MSVSTEPQRAGELQREAYDRVVAGRDEPFVLVRPPYFSPAAAAQDRAANGVLGHFAQMLLPSEYTTWQDESLAHVRSCYIGDWSPLHKIRIHGPQALAFLSWVGMNDLSSFELGQLKHHVQLDENGWVASEGILGRLGDDEFVYTAGSANWLEWQLATGDWDATADDISPDQFIFGVQGPRSLAVLEQAAGTGLRDLSFNRSREIELCGAPVRVLRTGISGELGYELHGPSSVGNEVWSAVVEAGTDHEIRQLGFRGMSVQHIEAGIATNGLDYLPSSILTPGAPTQFRQRPLGGSFVPTAVTDYFRKPGELGWGRRTAYRHDFLGREALDQESSEGGPARTLIGLVWDTDDVAAVFASVVGPDEPADAMELPRHQGLTHDRIVLDGRDIGISSGRSLSAHLRATISLGVVERAHAVPGTELTVIWGRPGTPQREIRATVTTLPFKPDHRRIDVTTL